MNHSLEAYTDIVGPPIIRQLKLLAEKLRGLEVVHVNSTSEGAVWRRSWPG
jgi:hypothetical protein